MVIWKCVRVKWFPLNVEKEMITCKFVLNEMVVINYLTFNSFFIPWIAIPKLLCRLCMTAICVGFI